MIRSTFALPIVLALLSLAGLVIALSGDGWPDTLSWGALSAPILVVIWAASARRSF